MIYKISEIATVVAGATPSTEIKENYDGAIYWITPKDLSNNKGKKYIRDCERKITKQGFESCSTTMIPANNILISTRAPIGYIAINSMDCCTNQGFKSLVCNNKFVDVDYLYYYLTYKMKEIEALGSGTTFKEVSKNSIENFEIDVPNLDVQRKISKILAKLDEQIDRNNAMVKKLQVLAQGIYCRWFLQFEYPNEEGHSFKKSTKNFIFNKDLNKKIPIGWEVKSLGDLIRKQNGTHNYKNDSPTIDLSVMPSGNVALETLNKSSNFTTNLYSMKEGNILFGSIRPYLKKCGVAPCDGAVAGTVFQFKPKSPDYFNYVLTTMSQDFFFDYAVKVSKGTKMPVVSDKDILSFKIAFNEEIVKKFSNLPLLRLLTKTVMMNIKLSNLKNRLLPLLINQQLK